MDSQGDVAGHGHPALVLQGQLQLIDIAARQRLSRCNHRGDHIIREAEVADHDPAGARCVLDSWLVRRLVVRVGIYGNELVAVFLIVIQGGDVHGHLEFAGRYHDFVHAQAVLAELEFAVVFHAIHERPQLHSDGRETVAGAVVAANGQGVRIQLLVVRGQGFLHGGWVDRHLQGRAVIVINRQVGEDFRARARGTAAIAACGDGDQAIQADNAAAAQHGLAVFRQNLRILAQVIVNHPNHELDAFAPSWDGDREREDKCAHLAGGEGHRDAFAAVGLSAGDARQATQCRHGCGGASAFRDLARRKAQFQVRDVLAVFASEAVALVGGDGDSRAFALVQDQNARAMPSLKARIVHNLRKFNFILALLQDDGGAAAQPFPARVAGLRIGLDAPLCSDIAGIKPADQRAGGNLAVLEVPDQVLLRQHCAGLAVLRWQTPAILPVELQEAVPASVVLDVKDDLLAAGQPGCPGKSPTHGRRLLAGSAGSQIDNDA